MTFATEFDARAGLIAASRHLAGKLHPGSGGSVSVRWHRGARDGFLFTASALAPAVAGVDDIVWLPVHDAPFPGAAIIPDPQSAVMADPLPASSPQSAIHQALYRQRDDAIAVVYSTASFAATLSCLPEVQRDGIPPFHPRVARAGGDTIRCADGASFAAEDQADAVLLAMQGRHACLLPGHGLIAIGGSLDAAVDLAFEVEYLARLYWQVIRVAPLVATHVAP